MKKIVFALAFAVIAMAFAACSKADKGAVNEEVKVYAVDEILAQPDALVDSVITLEGVCSHTCAHGAKKMFLLGSGEGALLRIEAGDLGSFDTACVSNLVSVTGILKEERLDESYLDDWATALAQEHGDGQGGCATENAAHGVYSTEVDEQIAEYRARIAERDSIEGKPYLSFYYVLANSYEIKEAKAE